MDDEVDTAGSMTGAAATLMKAGVTEVYACATHGLLSGNAAERIFASPIRELILTDTVLVPPEKRDGRISVLTVAGLFGEAIHRIHGGMSVGAMFDD